MAIALDIPRVDELGNVVDVLRGWQHDDAPMQLHPGDARVAAVATYGSAGFERLPPRLDRSREA